MQDRTYEAKEDELCGTNELTRGIQISVDNRAKSAMMSETAIDENEVILCDQNSLKAGILKRQKFDCHGTVLSAELSKNLRVVAVSLR